MAAEYSDLDQKDGKCTKKKSFEWVRKVFLSLYNIDLQLLVVNICNVNLS